MTVDKVFRWVAGGITSDLSDSRPLPYSDIVDEEFRRHGEVCKVDILPIVRHSTIEDLLSV